MVQRFSLKHSLAFPQHGGAARRLLFPMQQPGAHGIPGKPSCCMIWESQAQVGLLHFPAGEMTCGRLFFIEEQKASGQVASSLVW